MKDGAWKIFENVVWDGVGCSNTACRSMGQSNRCASRWSERKFDLSLFLKLRICFEITPVLITALYTAVTGLTYRIERDGGDEERISQCGLACM